MSFLAACRERRAESDPSAVSSVWNTIGKAAEGLGDLHHVTVSMQTQSAGSWRGSVGSPGRDRVSVSHSLEDGSSSASWTASPDLSKKDDLK
jgi:hypothetical protein